jgi:hypothetical protein
MILIAHRGLIHGPDSDLENNPSQIESVLKQGYDCEIDLWYVHGELYLGHDKPDYYIKHDFLTNFGLWIHAKNLGALRYLLDHDLHYFWHQNDDYVVTSKGIIWTFPGKELTRKSVMVMPEWDNPKLENIKDTNCYGICSDYVGSIK